MDTTPFAALSESLAARVREAAPLAVSLDWGGREQLSAILWRDGVVVTSEQSLPRAPALFATLPGGSRVAATLAGRDQATNIAVLRLEASAPSYTVAEPGGVGSLVLAIGGDGAGGATARMGGIEVLGPAWESQRGGKIDRLVRIGVRLPSGAEGGPVVDPQGGVLGMSTFGPRRGVMVIPAATIARGVDVLLRQGRMARGWLGVGLHPVELPRDIASRAGVDTGLMVVSLAEAAPSAGQLLPGDILTALDGVVVAHPRAVAGLLGPETVGRAMTVTLVRGGAVTTVQITIAARPE